MAFLVFVFPQLLIKPQSSAIPDKGDLSSIKSAE